MVRGTRERIGALLVAVGLVAALGVVPAATSGQSAGGVAVTTGWADALGETSEVVAANVTDLGTGGTANVSVEYRRNGSTDWSRTAATAVRQTGEVRFELTGLASGTTYEYRAVAVGNGTTDRGDVRRFTTLANDPVVLTDPASDVDATAATLNATVADLGGADDGTVWFQYRVADGGDGRETERTGVTEPGSVATRVTGLQSNATYAYRAVLRTSDGERVEGTTDSFRTDSAFRVATAVPTNVTATAATLRGEVLDFGGAESAKPVFEYRRAGAANWTEAPAPIASTGAVERRVTGLAPNATYEVRLRVTASDGETATGDVSTFATDADPAVATGPATDVGETGATVEATLESLGGAESVAVRVEYRRSGAANWSASAARTLTARGTASVTLTDLSPGTDYEYRAVATAGDGSTAAGEVATFATERPDRPPTVDRLSLADRSPPNPHVDLAASWRVSDVDGDLASATATIRDGDGRVVARDERPVTGASAAGSLSARAKHGAGERYELTVVVRDEAGDAVAETTSLVATRK